jgi:hypothetical protein
MPYEAIKQVDQQVPDFFSSSGLDIYSEGHSDSDSDCYLVT